MDFVVPSGHQRLVLVEAKASPTAVPQMATPLERLSAAISRYRLNRLVVYRPEQEAGRLSARRPGVEAGSLDRLLALLDR